MQDSKQDTSDKDLHNCIAHEFSSDFLQCLRGFYYTAQTGSMTAAAEFMNRNQSALSHQIKTIESELNVKLFNGSKTHRALTEEGKFLLTQVVELFDIINEIKMSIGVLPSDVKGDISIATTFTASFSYLAELFTSFCKMYPGVLFRYSCEMSQDNLFQSIASSAVDFGLTDAENIPQEFDSVPLFKANLALITPREGPYALTELPALEEICRLPLLAPPLRSRLWQTVMRIFNRYGCVLKYTHVIGQQEILKKCVANGLGVSILDDIACSGDIRSRIHVLPMTKYFTPKTYSILWRSNLYLHPHMRAFLGFLRDVDYLNSETA